MTGFVKGVAVQSATPVSAELWRDIPGHEGAYQVSSLGRVRSLPRVIPVYDSVRQVTYARPCPGKILRQAVCDKAGHVSVHLGKHCRGIPVHPLVMLAFQGCPPPGLDAIRSWTIQRMRSMTTRRTARRVYAAFSIRGSEMISIYFLKVYNTEG